MLHSSHARFVDKPLQHCSFSHRS